MADKPKNKGGRPRLYEKPKQMQMAIDMYFKANLKPTICGLALALGFLDRHSLQNYEGYSEEFFTTIKKARLLVENGYEKDLRSSYTTGAIFALKNFNWSDRQEVVTERNQAEQLEINEMRERLDSLENAGDGIPTG